MCTKKLSEVNIMIKILLSLAAVVACSTTAPVVQNCETASDLFAYCNKAVNDTELENNLHMLYIESDDMVDLLGTTCSKTVSNVVCMIQRIILLFTDVWNQL